MKQLINDRLFLSQDNDGFWLHFKCRNGSSYVISLDVLKEEIKGPISRASMGRWLDELAAADIFNKPEPTVDQVGLKEHAALEIAYAAAEAENAALINLCNNRLSPMLSNSEIALINSGKAKNTYLADAARLDKLQMLLDHSRLALLVKLFTGKSVRQQIDETETEAITDELRHDTNNG